MKNRKTTLKLILTLIITMIIITLNINSYAATKKASTTKKTATTSTSASSSSKTKTNTNTTATSGSTNSVSNTKATNVTATNTTTSATENELGEDDEQNAKGNQDSLANSEFVQQARKVKQETKNMDAKGKANFIVNMILSAKIIKISLTVIIVLGIYRLLLSIIIFKKAKRHAWEAIIPIYRHIAMLKICGMSPWWLLLVLIPLVGWSILWVVYVASRFLLAERFNKGIGFAFGLWLLWPIFEAILVFSKKTKYIKINQ